MQTRWRVLVKLNVGNTVCKCLIDNIIVIICCNMNCIGIYHKYTKYYLKITYG